MPTKPAKKKSRHGQYAKGQVFLGAIVNEKVKAKIAKMAAAENRTLSKYVALTLERIAFPPEPKKVEKQW